MRTILPLTFAFLGATVAPALAAPGALTVTSSSFEPGAAIPSEYTCDGAQRTPGISWSAVPPGTKSIALLMEDPDAPKGTFTHWLVTNIPATETSIADNASLPTGAIAASNDKGTAGYTGPCPPDGKHHYHFRVFALDTQLGKPASRPAFLEAIAGHVLAQGQLMGTYERAHGPTHLDRR